MDPGVTEDPRMTDPRKDLNVSILLVASDPLVRKVIADALDREGYVVVEAGDLGVAVDRLKEFPPDLLIVRPYLESISGHDAALYLRKLRPGLPVLLLGGMPDDSAIQDREFVQGFEIFPKPFPPSEMLEKVKDVLLKHPRRNVASRSAE